MPIIRLVIAIWCFFTLARLVVAIYQSFGVGWAIFAFFVIVCIGNAILMAIRKRFKAKQAENVQ